MMIAALSRFRVKNGREADVRKAFLERPGLVDVAPGFLGIETYTDGADQSVFYLLTRWTDAGSFRAWHRSEAHHESHKGIPPGLKLDPSQTLLVILDRNEGPDGPTAVESASDDSALLSAHLSDSAAVHCLHASIEGEIRGVNQAFVRSLGLPATALVGKPVWDVLPESDARSLRERVSVATVVHHEAFLLNFVEAGPQAPFTLRCRLDVRPAGFVLLGERAEVSRSHQNEDMLRMNNELATLSRESARKGRALERALEELKRTQAMLVHREKMASLGQMTAGVAHEINNPISFVLNNQITLRRDFEDLLGFVNAVGEALPALAELAPEQHRTLLERAEAVQLDYLAEAIPRKLTADLEGLERVKQIVLDLRVFCRLDEADLKTCDLAEGLRSGLRFLQPLLKEHGVSIETHFEPMPPLLCWPGALQQAVNNLVVNAVQASAPGQAVRLSTLRQAGGVAIVVEDSGQGIAPEHLSKVFDPFFTTKPVGSGTGLGLNIVQQIVEMHHGRIEIQSRLAEGTKMTISIPDAGGQEAR